MAARRIKAVRSSKWQGILRVLLIWCQDPAMGKAWVVSGVERKKKLRIIIALIN